MYIYNDVYLAHWYALSYMLRKKHTQQRKTFATSKYSFAYERDCSLVTIQLTSN